MSEHYYTQKPGGAHDRRLHESELRGRRYRFVTDSGVFSKSGVDFGSRLLIETMDFAPDAQVLDVGCGYGPIGLSAAVLAHEGTVTMIDINERAIELATENAQLNGIANVRILQSDLYEAVSAERFQVILTNPPIRAGKETVHRIYEEGASLLESGGAMWVVIQKKQGAPSTLAKLEQLFDTVREMTKDKGYRIFKAVKA